MSRRRASSRVAEHHITHPVGPTVTGRHHPRQLLRAYQPALQRIAFVDRYILSTCPHACSAQCPPISGVDSEFRPTPAVGQPEGAAWGWRAARVAPVARVLTPHADPRPPPEPQAAAIVADPTKLQLVAQALPGADASGHRVAGYLEYLEYLATKVLIHLKVFKVCQWVPPYETAVTLCKHQAASRHPTRHKLLPRAALQQPDDRQTAHRNVMALTAISRVLGGLLSSWYPTAGITPSIREQNKKTRARQRLRDHWPPHREGAHGAVPKPAHWSWDKPPVRNQPPRIPGRRLGAPGRARHCS
jgi:hypothetical protein